MGASVSVTQTPMKTHTLPGPFDVGASGQHAASIQSSTSHLPILHTLKKVNGKFSRNHPSSRQADAGQVGYGCR